MSRNAEEGRTLVSKPASGGDNELRRNAHVARNWMIGLGAWLLAWCIITTTVLEAAWPASTSPTSSVRVSLSTDLPSTNPQYAFSVYPLDIVVSTHGFILGFFMVILGYFVAEDAFYDAYKMHNNHWLRLFFGMYVNVTIFFACGQEFSITNALFLVTLVGFAIMDPILKYMQDKINPAMHMVFRNTTEGGLETDDDLSGKHKGVADGHQEAHFLGWLHFIWIQSIVLTYGISTAYAQGQYELTHLHPGRAWFTGTNMSVEFVGFGLLQLLHGMRYWKKSYRDYWAAKLRKLENFEVAYMVINVIIYSTQLVTLLFVGLAIGNHI